MSKNFYLWATILSPSSGRLLAAGLVERGYEVSSSARSGQMMLDGEASTLVSLKLSHDLTRTVDKQQVMRDVKEILGNIDAMYHSLVVHDLVGSFLWDGSNIRLPERPTEPVKEPDPPAPASRFDIINKD